MKNLRLLWNIIASLDWILTILKAVRKEGYWAELSFGITLIGLFSLVLLAALTNS